MFVLSSEEGAFGSVSGFLFGFFRGWWWGGGNWNIPIGGDNHPILKVVGWEVVEAG